MMKKNIDFLTHLQEKLPLIYSSAPLTPMAMYQKKFEKIFKNEYGRLNPKKISRNFNILIEGTTPLSLPDTNHIVSCVYRRQRIAKNIQDASAPCNI